MPSWLSDRGWLCCVVLFGLVVTGTAPVWGSDPAVDEDEEPPRFPGIVGTYTAGGRSVSRRDADVAFFSDAQAPVQQLPAGPLRARWQGKLLVRSPGKYRFYAQLQGHVTATLAKQSILTGETNPDGPAKWISGPVVEFEYGEHALDVAFQSTVPTAPLKLYWSSEAFGFEPIPSGAFFLNEAHPEFEVVSRGQELFAAHRCNRCHQREHDPLSSPGPDLTHVSQNLSEEGLERWMSSDRPASAAHFNMPEFQFTAAESSAIAAFLRSASLPVNPAFKFELGSVDPDNPLVAKPLAAGRILLHTTGCLACHSYGEVGSKSRLGGGDLSTIGAKRSRKWLERWLTEPEKLNADHRMPVFKWSDDKNQNELHDLVLFLSLSRPQTETIQKGDSPTEAYKKVLVEQGRKLVEAARCAACHRIPGVQNLAVATLPTLEKLNADSPNSCLQVKPNRENWRPGFPEKDLAALRAYVESREGKLSPEGAVERGQRLLAWNNCLQCHPREGVPGLGAYAVSITKLLPELGGAVPTLVPPSLNAVGDKLKDDVLLKSVAGEFPASRLPWLKVRMPKFTHSAEDRQALARYLTDHDRVDSPPAELVTVPPVPDASQRAQALVVGHSLLGSQGFSCIACHQFGKFQPRNTALGTRGSDLQNIGQRMRREYFLRWLRSPIRIVPDMEMPGYERPFPGLLGGQIQPQLGALWEALHDPHPLRPLDVTSLQQILIVGPGEPARIVRDVFAIPQAAGPDVYIPRAFAVGLNNQHNILMDLDTFSVREWWQGNFARQRTEGKSWYWDLAGTRVVTGIKSMHQIGLLKSSIPETNKYKTLLGSIKFSAGQLSHRLQDYSTFEQGVRFTYLLTFAISAPSSQQVVQVTETWLPKNGASPSTESGWSRHITVAGVPKDYVPVFVQTDFHNTLGTAAIDFIGEMQPAELKPKTPRPTRRLPETLSIVRLTETADGDYSGEFRYTAGSTPPPIESPSLPVAIATEETFSTVPGYTAVRLPLPRSIMPTAMTWTADDVLAFTSLKGHVYLARDTNGDGREDQLDLFEEGLAAPWGIITDPADGSLLVAHKPEILRLIDTKKVGRADRREVFATGWGYNDNYHDWTCGIVRDGRGNLYVGLGSDYTQPKRPAQQQLWRGKILRISPAGKVTPIASGLRYPTGLAMTLEGDLFVSDNQGEQNTFNELNHIVEGNRYGVPSREDKPPLGATIAPAIQIPHPWTRSINGIFFLPLDATLAAPMAGAAQTVAHPFAGHGIGCEYDSRYLIRFSLQKVGDTFQGAVYPFSQDQVNSEQPNFEGTLCGGVSPKGDIYIGCIHDSGWLGGLNVGSIVQLKSNGQLPMGIRELRATPQGFEIQFTAPVDRLAAAIAANYSISGYTREWKGTYATPDSNRHTVTINSVSVSADERQVTLHTDKLRTGYVYEVSCGKIGPTPTALWPAIGHYTMNRLPVEK